MTLPLMLVGRRGAAAFALSASLLGASAAAQTSDLAASPGGGPPARIGNHYDYRAFQPTQEQVCAQDPGGKQGGINCASPAGNAADRDLSNIQRQIDATDAKYPPGYLQHGDGQH